MIWVELPQQPEVPPDRALSFSGERGGEGKK
jgi:hypothetical protein